MFNYHGFTTLNVNTCIFIHVPNCLFKKEKIQIEGIRLELTVKLLHTVISKLIKFTSLITSDNKSLAFYQIINSILHHFHQS